MSVLSNIIFIYKIYKAQDLIRDQSSSKFLLERAKSSHLTGCVHLIIKAKCLDFARLKASLHHVSLAEKKQIIFYHLDFKMDRTVILFIFHLFRIRINEQF